jgi:ABC-type sugar transport systems, ATPase components
VTKVAAKDRDIAMVFQNYALYLHMSVAQTCASLRYKQRSTRTISTAA